MAIVIASYLNFKYILCRSVPQQSQRAREDVVDGDGDCDCDADEEGAEI